VRAHFLSLIAFLSSKLLYILYYYYSEQDLLEELPHFKNLCINDEPYLMLSGNIHQAAWIFTQQNILLLQEKCSFLNQTSPSREYMSSFSIFDNKAYHCGLHKLIPGLRLQQFFIHHYYQARHVSWVPTYVADELTRAGVKYQGGGNLEALPCWDSIFLKARAEQAIDLLTNTPTPSPTPLVTINATTTP